MIAYKPGKGIVYALNPLVKGFLAFVSVIFFSLNTLSVTNMSLALALLLISGLLCRLPVIEIIASIRRIGFLLLIVGLVQGFRGNGFAISYAAEGVIRILGVFIVAGYYLSLSPQAELMYFWEVVFRPLRLFKVPTRELALVMVIAVRFLPVMLGEIERIRMAQIARGARIGNGGILTSAASLMPLMIPTLSQALIRAEELAEAMEARGYRVAAARTRYNHFAFNCPDMLALVLTAMIFSVTVVSRL